MKAVHILNMLAYCHEVCSDHAVCMLTTGDPHQATPQPPRLSKGVDQFVMDDLGADKPRSSARAAAPYIDMVSERASGGCWQSTASWLLVRFILRPCCPCRYTQILYIIYVHPCLYTGCRYVTLWIVPIWLDDDQVGDDGRGCRRIC